uniref:Uncharacterized protein n=1 Tax=Rhizophora mucronata TaxID=61149 RepID=A0A2P2QYY0_RHIMU
MASYSRSQITLDSGRLSIQNWFHKPIML